jgi:hypothetical protein
LIIWKPQALNLPSSALHDPKVLANPTNRRVADAITGGGGVPKGSIDDTSFLSRIDDRLAHPFLAGFSSAMDLVFTTAGLVLLVGLVVVLFLPEEKLRSVSGLQAQRLQAAEQAAARTPGHDNSAAAAAVSAPSSQMVDGELVDEEPEPAPRR